MRRLAVLALLVVVVVVAATAETSLAAGVAGIAAALIALGGMAWYTGGQWLQHRRNVRRVRERLNRAVREAYTSCRRHRLTEFQGHLV